MTGASEDTANAKATISLSLTIPLAYFRSSYLRFIKSGDTENVKVPGFPLLLGFIFGQAW